MEGGVKMLALERSSVEGKTTFRLAYAQKFSFGLYSLDYPVNDTPQFFWSRLSPVLRMFRTKVVYLVLRSSSDSVRIFLPLARKILAIQGQV